MEPKHAIGRGNRSLRPPFWRTAAFGRGSESAQAKDRCQSRERSRPKACESERSHRPTAIERWSRSTPSGGATAHSGRRSGERRPSVAALKVRRPKAAFSAASEAGQRPARASGFSTGRRPSSDGAEARHRAGQPLTPAAVLANGGAPFAALKVPRPKAAFSAASEAGRRPARASGRAGQPLTGRTAHRAMEPKHAIGRGNRSLRPPFWRTAAFGRGSESAQAKGRFQRRERSRPKACGSERSHRPTAIERWSSGESTPGPLSEPRRGQPLTPAAVLANGGAPFAALKVQRPARAGQSTPASGRRSAPRAKPRPKGLRRPAGASGFTGEQ
jgi:hypothetical protein